MQWGGGKINVYYIQIEGVKDKFMIGVKHFNVTTEADNIFEEEQTLQIAEAIPTTPDTSEAQLDPNQDALKATADA